jgi:hypothetical protein
MAEPINLNLLRTIRALEATQREAEKIPDIDGRLAQLIDMALAEALAQANPNAERKPAK